MAELLVGGTVGPGDRDDRIVVVPDGPTPRSATLTAAAGMVGEKGPKVKAVLSHMDRGLQQRTGAGTCDAVVGGLADTGVVGPPTGGLRSRHPLLDTAARDAVVARLQAAAAGDGPIEPRTALVLSMTGPAHLLEVVAPDRSDRKHARDRIDHALDGSNLEPFGKVVRLLIQEAAAVASTAAIGRRGQRLELTLATPFCGWSDAAVEFYRELEANNDRSFWLAHTRAYDTEVRAPFDALSVLVADEFGPLRVFRPNRDVRFSKDKVPYKTRCYAVAEGEDAQSYDAEISAQGLVAAAGYWMMAGDQLTRYREAVDDKGSGTALARILADVRLKSLQVEGPGLKTAPPGYAGSRRTPPRRGHGARRRPRRGTGPCRGAR